ncbi:hypothetical protein J4218_04290 [Candidatus Pacearchaeota archaeon]|nr:hypothetical protein [Candidatus Pacearchaeota archaeon]
MTGSTIGEMPGREEVSQFIYNMFSAQRSVRGRTNGQLVTPQTPVHDFFHADVDGIDLCIGKPIGKRFGILDMVDFCIPQHQYQGLGGRQEEFYRKYPLRDLVTERFTLERFANMMYDLVRINRGLELEAV